MFILKYPTHVTVVSYGALITPSSRIICNGTICWQGLRELSDRSMVHAYMISRLLKQFVLYRATRSVSGYDTPRYLNTRNVYPPLSVGSWNVHAVTANVLNRKLVNSKL